MTSLVQDILVLVLVAVAAVYAVVRLRAWRREKRVRVRHQDLRRGGGIMPSADRCPDAGSGDHGQLPLLPPTCGRDGYGKS